MSNFWAKFEQENGGPLGDFTLVHNDIFSSRYTHIERLVYITCIYLSLYEGTEENKRKIAEVAELDYADVQNAWGNILDIGKEE